MLEKLILLYYCFIIYNIVSGRGVKAYSGRKGQQSRRRCEIIEDKRRGGGRLEEK